MITQRELELALEAGRASVAVLKALTIRYIAGEDIERGHYTLTQLLRGDRATAGEILSESLRILRGSLRLTREQRLMQIQDTGAWDEYLALEREYWRARLHLAHLGIQTRLYRWGVLDDVQAAGSRTAINEYLRGSA